MRNVIIGILLLLLAVVAMGISYKKTEGFETIMDKVQDRVNPLAAQTAPKLNPVVSYGVSESSGANIRALHSAALNKSIQLPGNNRDIKLIPDPTILSPRIDNQNSFLGMVKFCKETAANNADPWSDPTFAEHCGICVSDGSYITGDTFGVNENNGKGAGLLVYKADKDRAEATQTRNQFVYPRAIPSLNAGTCNGANLREDPNQAPVFAINKGMYDDMVKRNNCRLNKKYETDKSCGKCAQKGVDTWSYVKQPPKGLIGKLYLDLWGNGYMKISVNGVQAPGGVKLLGNTQKVTVDLSTVPGIMNMDLEGRDIIIDGYTTVDGQPELPLPIQVGGILKGVTINGNEQGITIEKLSPVNTRNTADGSVTPAGPGRTDNRDQTFQFFKGSPQAESDKVQQQFSIKFPIPFTFLMSDPDAVNPQIGYFDCKNTGFITTEQGENNLLLDDPCVKWGKTGNIADWNACFDKTLSASPFPSCTATGTWRQKKTISEPGYDTQVGKDPSKLGPYLRNLIGQKTANNEDRPSVAMGCYGRDIVSECTENLKPENRNKPISLPCAKILANNTITRNPIDNAALGGGGGYAGTSAFMDYGQHSNRLIEGYEDTVTNYAAASDKRNFQALNVNTPTMCRPEGKIFSPYGDALFTRVTTAGYKGQKGIDAATNFLKDVYERAVDEKLDIRVSEGQDNLESGASQMPSGRKEAWDLCFGIPIAPRREEGIYLYAPLSQQLNADLPTTRVDCPPTKGFPVYVDPNAKLGGDTIWSRAGRDWNTDKIDYFSGSDVYWIFGYRDYMSPDFAGMNPNAKCILRYNLCGFPFTEPKAQLYGMVDNQGYVKMNQKNKSGGTIQSTQLWPPIQGQKGRGIIGSVVNNVHTPIEFALPKSADGSYCEFEFGVENDSGTQGNPAGAWLVVMVPQPNKRPPAVVVKTDSRWTYEIVQSL